MSIEVSGLCFVIKLPTIRFRLYFIAFLRCLRILTQQKVGRPRWLRRIITFPTLGLATRRIGQRWEATRAPTWRTRLEWDAQGRPGVPSFLSFRSPGSSLVPHSNLVPNAINPGGSGAAPPTLALGPLHGRIRSSHSARCNAFNRSTKYSSSRRPYDLRSNTLILLFIPSIGPLVIPIRK